MADLPTVPHYSADARRIRRLYALVEGKGAQPVRRPFLSHLGARQAFSWRGPKTFPSPLPQGMKLYRLVCGWGSGFRRGSNLKCFMSPSIHSR